MSRAASVFFATLCIGLWFQKTSAQGPARPKNLYASIIQDTRNEPTPDGTFGYLYKTEDGIVSSARGGPNGVIQGGFSYTDPTGLKVNINYNAGSRTSPSAIEPSSREQAQAQRAPSAPRYYGNEINSRPRAPSRGTVYRPEPQYYDESVQDVQYQAPDPSPRYITRPQPEYSPQPGYSSQPEYRPRPVYRPRSAYRPQNNYPQRRPQPINNQIYDEYAY